MRKTAKRTDTAIIFTFVIMVVLIFISVRVQDNAPAVLSEQVSLDSYNGKPLGVQPGSPSEAVVVKRFPDSPLSYFNGFPELYTALTTKKIDGFVTSEIALKQMLRSGLNVAWFPEPLDVRYRYFGFPKTKKGEDLCGEMNDLLKDLKEDGTMAEMETIWYSEDESLKVLDDSGLTGENGTLHIGVSAMDEPYNYVKDNKLTGFNMDIVTRFAKRFGYAVEYFDTDPQGLLIGLTTGKFDMLATAISYTEERAQSVLFSDPVLEFNNMLAIRPEEAVKQDPTFAESLRESYEKTFIREGRWKLILEGIGTTCLVTFSAALLGTALSFAICLLRQTGSFLANLISDIYVKILQGTPMVVLLLILYYVVFGNSTLTAVWVAVIGFALHFGANNSETLRSGIESIPPGQREAALALGYSENQAFLEFILPQAVRRVLPVYRGEIITLLKGTAIAGYISVQDLTKMSDIIRSRTYEAFFPLILTAVIYFLLAWIISLLLTVAMDRIDSRSKGGKVK